MASLGSCIASVLILFGRHHGYELEGLKVELDWELADRPHRIGRIDIRVHLPDAIPEAERPIYERVAHTCLIHNTLTHPPQVGMDISFGKQRLSGASPRG
jgi:uncharacterized OsmC-like protein